MNANLTFSEIFTIVVVLLIVFGPHRLPEMARKAGMWVARAREAASAVKDEFTREYGEIAAPMADIERELRSVKDDLRDSLPTSGDIEKTITPGGPVPVAEQPAEGNLAAAADAEALAEEAQTIERERTAAEARGESVGPIPPDGAGAGGPGADASHPIDEALDEALDEAGDEPADDGSPQIAADPTRSPDPASGDEA